MVRMFGGWCMGCFPYLGHIGSHRAAAASSRSTRARIRAGWSPQPGTEGKAVLVDVGIQGASWVEVGEDGRGGIGRIKFKGRTDRTETAQDKSLLEESNAKSASESRGLLHTATSNDPCMIRQSLMIIITTTYISMHAKERCGTMQHGEISTWRSSRAWDCKPRWTIK